MTPHKRTKGAIALQKLKVFEGIPFPYDQKKKMVVPEALKVLRLKAHRKFCVLGDLASAAGWTKASLISTLEEKRKAKSDKYYQTKQKKVVAKAKAMGDKKLEKVNKELAAHGF